MSWVSQGFMRMGKSMAKWPHRIVKFTKHRLLTKKKSILIIGETTSPIYTHLYPKLTKSWEITLLTYQKQQLTNLLSDQAVQPSQNTTQQASSNTSQQLSTDKKALSTKTSDPTTKVNPLFTKIHINHNSYPQVQKQLQGKQYDSIVVLPNNHQGQQLEIDHDNFPITYPSIHLENIMTNVFAYRLASKYLTNSGVIILSSAQYDFLKVQHKDKAPLTQPQRITQRPVPYISKELIHAQINYLGVIIGDRDYTDVSSWSIVALSQQYSLQNSEIIALHYSLWADSQNLPMPGSFALFKRKAKDQKANTVVYL